MKLFRTFNIHVVSECQEQFGFVLRSVQLTRRAAKCFDKMKRSDSLYVKFISLCFLYRHLFWLKKLTKSQLS